MRIINKNNEEKKNIQNSDKSIDIVGNKGGSEDVFPLNSGYDNPLQLKNLFNSDVKGVSVMKHAETGRKAYEIELKNGDKVLAYDGFKDQTRPDLMLVREVDQNGEIGYGNKWKSTG
jgi:hypothetical protein